MNLHIKLKQCFSEEDSRYQYLVSAISVKFLNILNVNQPDLFMFFEFLFSLIFCSPSFLENIFHIFLLFLVSVMKSSLSLQRYRNWKEACL